MKGYLVHCIRLGTPRDGSSRGRGLHGRAASKQAGKQAALAGRRQRHRHRHRPQAPTAGGSRKRRRAGWRLEGLGVGGRGSECQRGQLPRPELTPRTAPPRHHRAVVAGAPCLPTAQPSPAQCIQARVTWDLQGSCSSSVRIDRHAVFLTSPPEHLRPAKVPCDPLTYWTSRRTQSSGTLPNNRYSNQPILAPRPSPSPHAATSCAPRLRRLGKHLFRTTTNKHIP